MTDDATLSDFGVDATDEQDGSSSNRSDADESRANECNRDSADNDGAERARVQPNPSLSTYAWGEYICARCSEESDRVWRDGDEFVCPGCKEW